MASIWKGSLAFGLVNVPVELRAAVREDHTPFRLLRAKDHTPIKYERVSSTDGKVVPWEDIVKGYEYSKGQFVVLTDEELKAAAPRSSHTIDILAFVEPDKIDFRYFDKPYYLVPGKGGDKAYALLREAMRRTGMVGIGLISIREKQHLSAVRSVGAVLVLELMRFPSELVDAESLSLPDDAGLRPQEVHLAEQLVQSLASPFDPSRYVDTYNTNLRKVIRSKLRGKKVEAPTTTRQSDTVVLDLMTRPRESLKAGPQERERAGSTSAPSPSARRSSRRKRQPA